MTNTTPVNNSSGAGKFILPTDLYDVAKDVALIYLPALGTFYFTLATVWNFGPGGHATEVVGTITAIDVLLGVWLKISKVSYDNSPASTDGTVTIINNAAGGADVQGISMDLSAEELADKGKVVLDVAQNDLSAADVPSPVVTPVTPALPPSQ